MKNKLKFMLLLIVSVQTEFLKAEHLCIEIPQEIPDDAAQITQKGKDTVFTYNLAPVYGCDSCLVTTNVNPSDPKEILSKG